MGEGGKEGGVWRDGEMERNEDIACYTMSRLPCSLMPVVLGALPFCSRQAVKLLYRKTAEYATNISYGDCHTLFPEESDATSVNKR